MSNRQCGYPEILFVFAGYFILVHWPEECSVPVVPDVKVEPCQANKGDDCSIRAGGKRYKGKVMDVVELIILYV